ncbi:UNVERIFIED_CONTAM: hypothetical protein GTU68_047075 [Idotea baltica]|nr:hypothetical protein [Idotea baltica]
MSEQTTQVGLANLSPSQGSKKAAKRIGRGSGSGSGKTSGKGHKGQKARSGGSIPAGFEGGQMPLHRRLPKVGFTSRKRVRGVNQFSIVQLANLVRLELGELTVDDMREKGLVFGKYPKVKIIGAATVEKAVNVETDAISAGARAAIEAAGGKVSIRS